MDLWRRDFLKQSISQGEDIHYYSWRDDNGKAPKLALKFEQDKFEFFNVHSQFSYIFLARLTT